ADAVALGDAFESLAQPRVAGGRLGEGQLRGGGLEVVAQERGIVAVAGGIDADATAARRLQGGSGVWEHGTLGKEKWRQEGAVAARALRRSSGREEACDKRSSASRCNQLLGRMRRGQSATRGRTSADGKTSSRLPFRGYSRHEVRSETQHTSRPG